MHEAVSNRSDSYSNECECHSNQHNRDSNQLPPYVNPEDPSVSLIQNRKSVCISLKTKRIEIAADLAKQLTNLSNLIFIYAKTMTQDPLQIERLLIELGRFLVESADAARSLSNPRSELAAELSMTSEMAVQEVVMQSFRRRDFSIFLRPLADVAKKLGISLPQEGSADAKILAYEAARITLDASKEPVILPMVKGIRS